MKRLSAMVTVELTAQNRSVRKKGNHMKANKSLMGVGCFAKPSTLARVLRRAMETYMMAPLESLEALNANASIHDRGAQWLRHLISGQASVPAGDGDEWMNPGAISGFFLGVEPCGLKLSIFTGGRAGGRKYRTARLDEVAALRRKRLH
ncbi:MAG: hypothetical protein KJO34_09015 [Deltaproteobacteria bacterium]|nr:hypothetical protein [Deltaproteobacteria bacterium]